MSPGQRSSIEAVAGLGRLTVEGPCTRNASFALLDATAKTIQTGELSGETSFDLPPATYSLLLTQFVPLAPVEVRVVAGREERVAVAGLGQLEVGAVDSSGKAISLPLEVFDDSGAGGLRPVATGQTNQPFHLPEGVYNVRVSADDSRHLHFEGGHNILIRPCGQAHSELHPRASLLVCRPLGRVEAWNDVTGQRILGEAGQEILLQPGSYNLRLSDGRTIPNVEIGRGVTRIGCE